ATPQSGATSTTMLPVSLPLSWASCVARDDAVRLDDAGADRQVPAEVDVDNAIDAGATRELKDLRGRVARLVVHRVIGAGGRRARRLVGRADGGNDRRAGPLGELHGVVSHGAGPTGH